MNYCPKCDTSYSENFRFCPTDGATLRSAAECEKQHGIFGSTGHAARRSKIAIRKWVYVALAIVITVGALLVFKGSRALPSPDQADSQPPVVEEGTKTKVLAKRTSVRPQRAQHARSAAKPDESDNPGNANEIVQQARVQQLVATGYRRIQQRDWEGARQAFEDALEIDPNNLAAQKGLNAAQTAESVQGVADVFRR